MRLVLYSKPGCHLCEGLAEKLAQVQAVAIALEIRDITTRDEWWQQYQYEIPVLCVEQADGADDAVRLVPLPRLSPRGSVRQLEQMLQKYQNDPAQ